MKILLINPPVEEMIKTELPEFIRSEVGIAPPLGLMYLAAYLKLHKPQCDVRILDAIAAGMSTPDLIRYADRFSPDVAGITTHTHNLCDTIALVRGIKLVNPDIHVTLGGAHVNVFPRESVKIPGVDSVVIGEGETTFFELVDCLCRKGDLNKVRGILFKDGAVIRQTPAPDARSDLDAYPYPQRDGLYSKRYRYALTLQKGRTTTMISSRGCPYVCSFCGTSGGNYRFRSAQNIVDEMEHCLKRGIREVNFVDDTFGFDQDHAYSVCAEIDRRGLKIKWGIRARIDRLNEKLLHALKVSGCGRINFGVETSSDEGLAVLKKGITISQIRNVFRWAKDAGIMRVAYFMIGCPHEKTKADARRTIDFALELDPEYAMFNILALYPGTELYREGINKGIVKGRGWEDFVRSPHRGFEIPFWEEWLSRKDLSGLVKEAYRRFYLRPKFIRCALKSGFTLRKVVSGLKILSARDKNIRP